MKKLASILAITGVVANLGLASMVFAQSNVNATETIGCNSLGTVSISYANPNATFQSRTVNFYQEEVNAPLSATAPLVVKVADTRGYDATTSHCALGSTLSVISSGLVNATEPAPLLVGVGTDIGLTHTSWDGVTGSPADISTISSWDTNAGHDITSMTALWNSTESFSGVLKFAFSGNDLEVRQDELTGPIAKGDYTGTITFELS